jgi:hypothetical protein
VLFLQINEPIEAARRSKYRFWPGVSMPCSPTIRYLWRSSSGERLDYPLIYLRREVGVSLLPLAPLNPKPVRQKTKIHRKWLIWKDNGKRNRKMGAVTSFEPLFGFQWWYFLHRGHQ